MEALILSCGTGGGHNAAAEAIVQELTRRGHSARMLDPYSLLDDRTAARVGNAYIRLVQWSPRMFGVAYQLGMAVRRIPGQSPVYWFQRRLARGMERYLREHPVDVIVMPHLFPAEAVTWLRRHGAACPPSVFVATDYTCIPFTEETDCDAYVIPAAELAGEFRGWGIPAEKLHPLGIPVRQQFRDAADRDAERRKLGLDPARQYLLLSGGSIGCGSLAQVVAQLRRELKPEQTMIVICGNHQRLFQRLSRLYSGDAQVQLLQSTPHMASYMRACDVFFTKPGGLSSTEAAVMEVPLVHLAPIPGCETHNEKVFASHGMSLSAGTHPRRLRAGVRLISDSAAVSAMRQSQHRVIPHHAAEEICSLLERMTREA